MGRSDLLEKAGGLMLQEVRAQRYQWIQNNGKGYIQLPLLNHPSAFHVFGTRLLAGDCPAGAGPSPKITALGRAETLIQCRQVHGDQICRVTAEGKGFPQAVLTGDGLTTDSLGVFVAVSTADCVPVLLFDPARRAVSAVHAGWRGSCLNISAKAVNAMQLYYGSKSKDLLAGIGPSIGPCCYEVGSDVWGEIEKNASYGKRVVLHRDGGKAMLDLAQLNRLQLIEAGLQPERIHDAGLCASCYPNLFYSFRRDGKKIGSMMSGIMLLSEP